MTDDSQRLKCFDGLFAKVPAAREAPATPPGTGEWRVETSKSELDDSPQISGTMITEVGAAIVLRCQEKQTEVLFGKIDAYLGSRPMRTLVRINDGKLIETTWNYSTNGKLAFAPSPIEFIRALPDNGKLFIRVFGFDGTPVEGTFDLKAVSEVRNKIALACRWPQN